MIEVLATLESDKSDAPTVFRSERYNTVELVSEIATSTGDGHNSSGITSSEMHLERAL